MFWIVRTADDPMALASSLTRAVRRIDPEVVAAPIRPLDQYLSEAMAARRFSLSLMSAFALAALALALTGIYAVVMYSVSQRGREFAIRSALGAQRSDLMLLVMRQGVAPSLTGIGVGLAVAWITTRTLSSMLFGLSATDPAIFAAVALALFVVAMIACLGPGLRASGKSFVR
jgi:putative ABC transport system permease protein